MYNICIVFIYDKCVKNYFGLSKYSSLTLALLQTGLPSCITVIHNFKFRFRIMISTSTNVIVKAFEFIGYFFCLSLPLFSVFLYSDSMDLV